MNLSESGEPGALAIRPTSPFACQEARAEVAARRGPGLIALFTTVAGFGLLANVLGYLREIALAASYGSSATTDAFFGAVFIPNTLYTIIASGAGAAVLVPVLVEYRQKGDAEARELALTLLNLTSLILLILTLALTLTSSFWIRLVFPGFASGTNRLAVDLAWVLNPSVLFLSVAAILAGVLNAFGHFRVVAVAPCIGNVVTVLAICMSAHWGGIQGAALGVAIGALVQFAVMAWMAFSRAVRYKMRLRIGHPGVKAFAGMAAPTIAYLVVAYLSLTAERVFASGFSPGALSMLSYAMRLFVLPASIVAGSIATVLHTEFSVFASRGEMDQLGVSFRRGVDLAILVLIPVSIGALVFSRTIVAAAYGYGKFSGENVGTTAATFAAYSLGIIPLALATLCQRLFYALRMPRMLLIIECAAFAVYLITAPALGRLFSLPGLALARSGSFFLVGGLSLAFAVSSLAPQYRRVWLIAQFGRCGLAAVPTTLFWIALAAEASRMDPSAAGWARLFVLVAGGSVGAALYLAVAHALRCREADNVIRGGVGLIAQAARGIRRVKSFAS